AFGGPVLMSRHPGMVPLSDAHRRPTHDRAAHEIVADPTDSAQFLPGDTTPVHVGARNATDSPVAPPHTWPAFVACSDSERHEACRRSHSFRRLAGRGWGSRRASAVWRIDLDP